MQSFHISSFSIRHHEFSFSISVNIYNLFQKQGPIGYNHQVELHRTWVNSVINIFNENMHCTPIALHTHVDNLLRFQAWLWLATAQCDCRFMKRNELICGPWYFYEMSLISKCFWFRTANFSSSNCKHMAMKVTSNSVWKSGKGKILEFKNCKHGKSSIRFNSWTEYVMLCNLPIHVA